MAVAFFSSGPVELLTLFLESCDTPSDVLALTSTCRYVRDVWIANHPGIIWKVWRPAVPGFDEALVAARATKVVMEAQARDVLPPKDLFLGEMSGHVRQPSIEELHAALGLTHLARVFEVQFMTYWGRGDSESPDRMAEWSERVRKALLRTFIAGAALYGAYREPLFEAGLSGDVELQSLAELQSPAELQSLADETRSISDHQLKFLEKFAVCRMEPVPEADDAVFGPLAQWFVDSIFSDGQSNERRAFAKRFDKGIGRAGYCRSVSQDEDDECAVRLVDGGDHSDAHLVVWQAMQMFWVINHTNHNEIFTKPSPGGPFEPYEGRPRKTHAVIFSDFRLLEFVDAPEAVQPRRLAVSEPFTTNPGAGRGVQDILKWIHRHSGQPNRLEEEWTLVPPLEIKFIEYILRRHLGVRLLDCTFDDDWGNENNNGVDAFVDHLGIFAHDDIDGRKAMGSGGILPDGDFLDGSEMLCRSDPVPTRVYDHYDL